MKTKEERDAAKLARQLKKEKEILDFPYARLDCCRESYGVVVQMEAGNNEWLTVSHRGQWGKSHHDSWTETEILLEDPIALAQFIRALTARYNAIVCKMNAHASECGMAQGKDIA